MILVYLSRINEQGTRMRIAQNGSGKRKAVWLICVRYLFARVLIRFMPVFYRPTHY